MEDLNLNFPIRLLLVEDNPGDALLIEEILSEVRVPHFELEKAEDLASARRIVTQGTVNVALLDLSLPDSHGIETFIALQETAPSLPIVVLTGFDDQGAAMRAVRTGAQDYLVKGQVDHHLLPRALCYAIERKRVQEQIRTMNEELERRVVKRTSELAEANDALANANLELHTLDLMKSAFISVTSHELRTPVTIVNGMVKVLADRIPRDNTELLRGFSAVTRAVDRLTRIVARVLEIAEAGQYDQSLTITTGDVRHLFRQIVEDVRTFTQQRHQEMIEDVAPDVPLIPMDQEKIRDALLNLVMNAIKFTPDGGRITLSAQIVDEHVEIRVTDTGIGIGDIDRAHLFEKFFAGLDCLTHSSGEFEFCKKGIGLGLAIVKQFVQMHGGKVGASSHPNEGSVFYFTLPLHSPIEEETLDARTS